MPIRMESAQKRPPPAQKSANVFQIENDLPLALFFGGLSGFDGDFEILEAERDILFVVEVWVRDHGDWFLHFHAKTELPSIDASNIHHVTHGAGRTAWRAAILRARPATQDWPASASTSPRQLTSGRAPRLNPTRPGYANPDDAPTKPER